MQKHKARLPVCVLLVLAAMPHVSVFAGSASGIEEKMLPLLLKVRSADAAERKSAVAELMGIREAVSESLRRVVADEGAGLLSQDSKASGLYLMGVLGLWQCKDLLESERDWRWETLAVEYTVGYGKRDTFEKGPHPGRTALARADLGSNVTVTAVRQTADLSSFPLLAGALDNLRSEDTGLRREGEDAVLEWYRVVSEGLASAVETRPQPLYSTDVEIAAVWLLGEYRVPVTYMALMADADDEDGLTGGYGGALQVSGLDASRYAAQALVKCGRRVQAHDYVHSLRSARLTQAAREFLARALTLIDAEAALEAYEDCVRLVRNGTGVSRDPAGDLERLRSVEPIIVSPAASP